MSKYFIGIDAGTSLVKSVLFNMDGEELFVSKQKTEVLSPKPNWSEQDMTSVYEATILTLRSLVLQSNISAEDILAIGLTAQGDGCWMIDTDGNPLRNAILWSDGRAADIINQWQIEGISDKAYSICGSTLFPGAQSAILKWLNDNEPENVSRMAYAFYCKDWIRYKLTGDIATDESDASLPHLDIKNKVYSDKLLEYYGTKDLKHVLPKIIPSTDAISYITEEVSILTGLKPNTPLVTAPFDTIASSIGVGAIHGGDACSIVGTTCFNEVTMDTPDTSPANVGMTIAHGIPNKWMKSLGAMMGTPNLDWFIDQIAEKYRDIAKTININLFDYFESQIKNIPIGSHGIVYHPYLSSSGERAPFVKSTARAQFTGICTEHTKYDMLRAVYEGVAMEMLDCYKHMPGEINEVRLSGGGASSAFWCQMFADALGKVMKVPAGSEFGAKGSVINAAVALNIFESFDEAVAKMIKIERTYIPNMENHEKYEKLYEVYKDIYYAQWNVWDKLNDVIKMIG